MAELTPIFLYGAGGHARAVSEVVRREGRYRIACVLDDDPQAPPLGGVAVFGGRDQLADLPASGPTEGVVAIGNNADRELIMTLAARSGLTFVTVVDPTAVVASDATVGDGTVLMPLCFIGAGATVGNGVIVNTSATADHDCRVEDFAHLSVGSHLTGECIVGARSFIGIGAVLGRPVRVGQRAMVGAGSAVIGDVGDGEVVAGVPARPISTSP